MNLMRRGRKLGHEHSHGNNKKALLISFLITGIFMIVEAIGGWVTNSLALLSDAGHMLSDTVSLGIGVVAFKIGEKAADYSKTYGYKRFEILAALFNGITLAVVSIYIFYEAIRRFGSPPEISSTGMLVIAVIGLLVNIIVAFIMHSGDTHANLNLRAAFLHVIGDLLGSVGAIIAAILIKLFGWGLADPIASVIVAILVLVSAWRVLRDSLQVLMEGVPKGVEVDHIIKIIRNVPGVIDLHHLHIWAITNEQRALSCHLVIDGAKKIEEGDKILQQVEQILAKEHIEHVTIQLESERHHQDDTIITE